MTDEGFDNKDSPQSFKKNPKPKNNALKESNDDEYNDYNSNYNTNARNFLELEQNHTEGNEQQTDRTNKSVNRTDSVNEKAELTSSNNKSPPNDQTVAQQNKDIASLKLANSNYEASLNAVNQDLQKKHVELSMAKNRVESHKKKLNSMNNLDVNDQRIVNLTNIILEELGTGKIDLSVVNKINEEVVNFGHGHDESRISEEDTYQNQTEESVLCSHHQGRIHHSNIDSTEHLTDYDTGEYQNNNDEGLIYGLKEQIYALKGVVQRLEEDCRRKDLDNNKMAEQCDKYKKRLIDMEDMIHAPGSVNDNINDEENFQLKDNIKRKDDEIEDLRAELNNVKKVLTDNKIAVNFDDSFYRNKNDPSQHIKGVDVYHENNHKNIEFPEFRNRSSSPIQGHHESSNQQQRNNTLPTNNTLPIGRVGHAYDETLIPSTVRQQTQTNTIQNRTTSPGQDLPPEQQFEQYNHKYSQSHDVNLFNAYTNGNNQSPPNFNAGSPFQQQSTIPDPRNNNPDPRNFNLDPRNNKNSIGGYQTANNEFIKPTEQRPISPVPKRFKANERSVNILTWDQPYGDSPGKFKSRYVTKPVTNSINPDPSVDYGQQKSGMGKKRRYPQQYNDNYTNIFGIGSNEIKQPEHVVTPDSNNQRRERRYIAGNYKPVLDNSQDYTKIVHDSKNSALPTMTNVSGFITPNVDPNLAKSNWNPISHNSVSPRPNTNARGASDAWRTTDKYIQDLVNFEEQKRQINDELYRFQVEKSRVNNELCKIEGTAKKGPPMIRRANELSEQLRDIDQRVNDLKTYMRDQNDMNIK